MTTLTSPISSAKTTDLVFTSKTNKLVTSSLVVSEYFGKLHKNVLRSISNLECSDDFNRLNFERVHYHDKKGEIRQAYQMTKDGFMFLVMGFTGKRAAEIKERYIEAFNEMESELSKHASKLPNSSNPIDEINFMHQRWLVVVEKGEITSKRALPDDEYLFNRRQFINYFKEPDIGFHDVEQLAELSRVVNERLCRQVATTLC